ncbi:MAG TPA: cytochrome ubiquinol oxidase subunit I [Candidatus Marinimicrobia bacterium]|nr:cytochrome ubiquinol oxidase subunit I [Candidatus Neomarinimicrobiota bacterium]
MEVILARWQFAITSVYHFFFVPLTLGLVIFVAVMETMYVRTGNETYKKLTKFWGKLFLINFAMGVVTGIVMEFQFGLNWSEYSRFVGDIFGAPLAVEALLAFFLESTFLGVWIFGWDKLSKKGHLTTIWLVAIGSNLSALWILIANSFMQEPMGYVLNEVTGRAEMTSFFALLQNPHVWYQFSHVFFSAVTTAGFFVLGVTAWHFLKEKKVHEAFHESFKVGMLFALVGIIFSIGVGHAQGQHMVKSQPMKMAAAEALWETEEGAGLSLFSVIDQKNRQNKFSIEIPGMLSFLAWNSFSKEVRGINDIQAEYEKKYGPGDYAPPIWITFWSFRLMVGAGTFMALLAIFGIFLVWKKKYENKNLLMRILLWSIALPYIANSFGWILTEVGRAPWIVFGLMKIEDAASIAVSTGEIVISLLVFTLLYGFLMVVDVYLLQKYAKKSDFSIASTKA